MLFEGKGLVHGDIEWFFFFLRIIEINGERWSVIFSYFQLNDKSDGFSNFFLTMDQGRFKIDSHIPNLSLNVVLKFWHCDRTLSMETKNVCFNEKQSKMYYVWVKLLL